MKGIGKKVTVAFLSVVALLAVSGIISLSELSNLSYDTDEILVASNHNVEIAKDLLSAVHDHSRAMLDVAVFDNKEGREACDEALRKIGAHITSEYSDASDEIKQCLDTLAKHSAVLQTLSDEYCMAGQDVVAEASMEVEKVVEATPAPVEQPQMTADSLAVDSMAVAPVAPQPVPAKPKAKAKTKAKVSRVDGRKWYVENYEPAYDRFVAHVKHYITLSHDELAPKAEQLSKNAYRSVTPVLISLAVMISIVLMLYYFIYIYGVKPILSMDRSLSDYLSFKLPYKTKVDMIDEVKNLSDNIEHLINSSNSSVKQKKDAI